MKYRKNKIKIEHSIIKGLRRFLEDNISGLDHVTGIIPGEIKVGRATGENLAVSYKYNTRSGGQAHSEKRHFGTGGVHYHEGP